MPQSCVVHGCNSGYRSCKEPRHLFKIPKDPIMRKKWKKAIDRTDFTYSENARVCSLHFEDEFLISSYKYIIGGQSIEIPRGRMSLARDAVPTLFPKVPCNESTTKVSKQPKQPKLERRSQPVSKTGAKPQQLGTKRPALRRRKQLNKRKTNSHENAIFPDALTTADAPVTGTEPRHLPTKRPSLRSRLQQTPKKMKTRRNAISPDDTVISCDPVIDAESQQVHDLQLDGPEDDFQPTVLSDVGEESETSIRNRKRYPRVYKLAGKNKQFVAINAALRKQNALLTLENAKLKRRAICSEENLKGLPQKQKLMFQQAVRLSKCKNKSGMRFSTDWMLECGLLYFQSPSNYNFLRDNEFMPLPNPVTLHQRIKYLHGKIFVELDDVC